MMRKWFGLIGGFGVAAWLLYAAWPQTRIEVVLPQQRCYLAGQDFTLQWRHSVEHQLWQEHYRLDGRQLWLDATYMQTFGAGTPSGGQPLLAPPGFIGQRSQVRLPELNWVVSRRAENRIHTHQTPPPPPPPPPGPSSSKAFFVMSSQPDQVAEAILVEMDRGVTLFHAKGCYTGKPQEMLLCVVSTSEVTQLKELIYEIDHKAFVIVTSAHEVLGEGFTEVKRSKT